MLAVKASFGNSPDHASAFKLLQISHLSQLNAIANNDAADGKNSPSAYLAIGGNPKISTAIRAIINILLDAQKNSEIGIFAKQGAALVRGADGDDGITLDVHQVLGVSSGKGNDTITIRTYASRGDDEGYYSYAVGWVDSGEGNDSIAIDSHGHVEVTLAGDGDDVISIRSSAEYSGTNAVNNTDGGGGNDKIGIASQGMVDLTDGEAGDDTIDISGHFISRTFGGEGEDTLRITAERTVGGVWGGDGNDSIEVTAPTIIGINGGKGDDTIVLNNTANAWSHLGFNVGDGHDVVHSNSAVVIERWTGHNQQFDMRKASIERVGDSTLKITFGDADDSITLHLAGDMAGKPLAVEYYENGGVMIRRDDADAPALPAFTHALNPVVLTRHA